MLSKMQKILCLIAIATIAISGCSTLKVLESSAPAVQTEAETAEEPSAAKKEAAKLPPEADSNSAFQQIANATRRLAPSDQSGEFSLTTLKKESVKQRLNGLLINNCELEHLKALVASNKAPIVILKTADGVQKFMAVISYKDANEQIMLTNPFRQETVTMKYAEFEPAWKGTETSQSALLLSARSVKATQIEQALTEYLPEEKLANLTFN
jgi:hypothetical protein